MIEPATLLGLESSWLVRSVLCSSDHAFGLFYVLGYGLRF